MQENNNNLLRKPSLTTIQNQANKGQCVTMPTPRQRERYNESVIRKTDGKRGQKQKDPT